LFEENPSIAQLPSKQFVTDIKHIVKQLIDDVQNSRLQHDKITRSILLELSIKINKLSREITTIEEERRDLRALADIGWVINSSLELNEVLRIVMDKIIELTDRMRAGVFTKSGRDILAAFANQAAIAIDNARLFRSVRKTLDEVIQIKTLMGNVFASIASGVITTNKQNQVTFCNKAASQILNLDPNAIHTKQITSWLSSFSPKMSKMVEWVQQNNRPLIGYELNPLIPNRGHISISVSITPLKDPSGTHQGIVIVLDDLTERRKLEAQYRLFERMVSPALIDQLDPDKIQLGGEKKLITTIFADIRGYTKFSEGLSPEKLISILNLYLSAAADAIINQGGTIDKFQGDAVIAWFNAPIKQPNHTLRAVKAALDIQHKINKLHQSLPPEFRLTFGIGIHSGEAVLGLIGTEKRLDYTAIGDSINIAKRIQESATDNQILISAETYHRVKNDIHAKQIAPLNVKGKSKPLLVYEVVGEIHS